MEEMHSHVKVHEFIIRKIKERKEGGTEVRQNRKQKGPMRLEAAASSEGRRACSHGMQQAEKLEKQEKLLRNRESFSPEPPECTTCPALRFSPEGLILDFWPPEPLEDNLLPVGFISTIKPWSPQAEVGEGGSKGHTRTCLQGEHRSQLRIFGPVTQMADLRTCLTARRPPISSVFTGFSPFQPHNHSTESGSTPMKLERKQALWEAEAGGSPEVRSLRPPGQHGETLSLLKTQKLARYGDRHLQSQLLGKLRQENRLNLTLGGQGRQITMSGVRDRPGQYGKTLSLIKIQKLAGRKGKAEATAACPGSQGVGNGHENRPGRSESRTGAQDPKETSRNEPRGSARSGQGRGRRGGAMPGTCRGVRGPGEESGLCEEGSTGRCAGRRVEAWRG
ncbi:hypothetical protein AAY473_011280 [Plecturocebus cupreus]